MKKREQQGGEKKRMAPWKNARENRVQNTTELMVDLEPSGKEREKKRGEKKMFVAKK